MLLCVPLRRFGPASALTLAFFHPFCWRTHLPSWVRFLYCLVISWIWHLVFATWYRAKLLSCDRNRQRRGCKQLLWGHLLPLWCFASEICFPGTFSFGWVEFTTFTFEIAIGSWVFAILSWYSLLDNALSWPSCRYNVSNALAAFTLPSSLPFFDSSERVLLQRLDASIGFPWFDVLVRPLACCNDYPTSVHRHCEHVERCRGWEVK